MFTEAGTVSAGLLLLSATLIPPLGAAAEIVTLQFVAPGVGREIIEQLTFVTCGKPAEGSKVSDEFAVVPFAEAETNTLVFAPTAAADPINEPLFDPPAKLTDAGMVNAGLLLLSATENPPVGARRVPQCT